MTAQARHAIAASTLFDGERLHRDSAVIVEGARIADIVLTAQLSAGMPVRHLPGGQWLAPGFIDIQVNGGGDVLFNDAPSPETIAVIGAAHRRFGTTGFLPALITDSDETMERALSAVTDAMRTQPNVLGIHFEGPFLSREKHGVHDPARMRAPSARHRELLMSLQNGVTLLTCAPECVPEGFISQITSKGIRVALGHSMATYEGTRRAMAEGMTGFTHLFNAMRPMTAREPGPIAAALESRHCWYGLIADGAHVAPAMLRLALRGLGALMLVTDAMPPVGGKKLSFQLQGQAITVKDGRCLTRDSVLAGSVLDMASAVRNVVRMADVALTDALRMASLFPAQFLGIADRFGRIASGYRADLVALDPETIRVKGTWLAGGYISA